LIDSDSEEKLLKQFKNKATYQLKQFKNKATYHGQRHTTTMYTNHHIKVANIPLIANHFFDSEGQTSGSIKDNCMELGAKTRVK
jgi:hypothetical protein